MNTMKARDSEELFTGGQRVPIMPMNLQGGGLEKGQRVQAPPPAKQEGYRVPSPPPPSTQAPATSAGTSGDCKK